MKTYVEVYVNTDGEAASKITETFKELGFESSFGEHDFVYTWKEDVTIPNLIDFVDKVQARLKGTGALLHFTTAR